MIEDKATEKWKKRLTDMGLIVNAGADKAASQPRKTRHRSKERQQWSFWKQERQ